ncbi:TauD/TfdA family dioxygenase [Halomonas citrativorans]|uniref:TauD/TfdA family dioxygenase n=1 Tax=Halomonas citrativorans TaxID=2742612 RepID=UPI0020CFA9F6|nr:TauD/TfdA family dioxygenase [Halomonas citrativorans]
MTSTVFAAEAHQAPQMGEFTPYYSGPSLSDAMLTEEGVTLTWQTSDVTTLPLLWLRDHCACPECRHPQTRERLYIPLADINEAPDISLQNGHLYLHWKDGHTSAFHSGWLYQRRPETRLTSPVPKSAPWVDNFFPERILHADLLTPAGEKAWITALLRDGLALVTEAPLMEEEVSRLAERIGPLRTTNFGARFNVRSKPNPNNAAYTAAGLPLHIDLPNWQQPPDIQLLYCLKNEASGGESLFADGVRVVNALRHQDSNALTILSETPIDFRFQDEATDITVRAPVITLDSSGNLVEIRLNNWIRDTLHLPASQMNAWYRAYRTLWQLFHSEAHQLEFTLRPGQMVAFDNRRVLHGRREFDPNSGARHLQGTYLDRDMLASRLRVLARHS